MQAQAQVQVQVQVQVRELVQALVQVLVAVPVLALVDGRTQFLPDKYLLCNIHPHMTINRRLR